MSDSKTKSGFAAIVGRPNVGKSTLLNGILGQKISIVTPKPQTTRHRIIGVKNHGSTQILFVDTPGLQLKGRKAIDKIMNRNAQQSIADADVVIFLTEFGVWKDSDENVLTAIKQSAKQVVGVVNKIDLSSSRVALLPQLQQLSERYEFDAIFPVSAKTRDNVAQLVDHIANMLPQSPWLYPADMSTDKDVKFRSAEIIREKLIMELQQELPYGLSVEIESWQQTDKRTEIAATIWLERESQKPILIGKSGSRLKRVGTDARKEISRLLDDKVHLELWAKTRKNWSDDARILQSLGYETNE